MTHLEVPDRTLELCSTPSKTAHIRRELSRGSANPSAAPGFLPQAWGVPSLLLILRVAQSSNKFRRSGFIDYDGGVTISDYSLLGVVLRD